MNKTLLTLAIAFLSLGNLKAQVALDITKNDLTESWTTNNIDNSPLEILSRLSECINKSEGIEQEKILLSFHNPTSTAIVVSYDLELHYTDRCYNCNENNPEMHFQLELAPNATMEGSCDMSTSSGRAIHAGFLNLEGHPSLKSFRLKNIQISLN